MITSNIWQVHLKGITLLGFGITESQRACQVVDIVQTVGGAVRQSVLACCARLSPIWLGQSGLVNLVWCWLMQCLKSENSRLIDTLCVEWLFGTYQHICICIFMWKVKIDVVNSNYDICFRKEDWKHFKKMYCIYDLNVKVMWNALFTVYQDFVICRLL